MAKRQRVWALQDGAPAHSSHVAQYLDTHYTGRCRGRNGPAVSLPQSPDLTPADLHLWGHLESIVYVQWCNMRKTRRMPFKGLGRHAGCCSAAASGFSYELTAMVDCFNITCKPLVPGQMPLCLQPITLCVQLHYLFTFLSSCFLLPYVLMKHLRPYIYWIIFALL
jgi:hypothetical protein